MPNPTINSITMPSGNVYDIEDTVARAAIGGGITVIGVSINAITDGDNTNPITIGDLTTEEPSDWSTNYTDYYTYSTSTGTFSHVTGETAPTWTANTYYKAKSVSVIANNAILYAKKEFIFTSIDERWHEFGDITGLGALAFKDSASATYTPAGTVSQPSFEGSSLTSTGTFTPSGSVSAPTISVTSAGSTDSITELSVTVSGESLVFSSADTTVKTGDATYGASQPTFTGSEGSVSVSGTPSGTVSQPTFSGTQATITST